MGWFQNSTLDNLANYLIPGRRNNGVQGFSFQQTGQATRAGLQITPENALQNSTVFACANLIADTCAQTEVAVVDRASRGFNPLTQHPVTRLLNRPNELQTRYEFIHTICMDMLTFGNSYIQIVGQGAARQLVPLDPRYITISQNAAGRLIYRVDTAVGGTDAIDLTQNEVLHFRDIAVHQGRGLSRVLQCADLVALDNRLDYAVADILKNANRITGVLTTPNNISEDDAKLFQAALEKFTGDGDAVGSTAVFGGGATYQQIDFLSMADADAIALKKLLMARIAAIFRVPAQYIELADNNKYNNVSQKKTGFYSDTISPFITNLEQKITMKLLTDADLAISFDRDTLLKGDLTSQAGIASTLRSAGIWTANDARRFMGDDVLDMPEADQLNMGSVTEKIIVEEDDGEESNEEG